MMWSDNVRIQGESAVAGVRIPLALLMSYSIEGVCPIPINALTRAHPLAVPRQN
jgi:hypothetical protein